MEENKTEQGYCYKYPRPAVTTDVVLFAMVDSHLHQYKCNTAS